MKNAPATNGNSPKASMPNEQTMDSFIHYKKAPIVEAILEASVERATPIHSDELAEIVKDKAMFPHRVELMAASGQMTVGPTLSASATTQKIGYQFVSADQKFVLHCRVDGFAISRLAPYTSWNDVYVEYAKHWKRFVEIIRPDQVVKLAVRYVNRFDLPGTSVELSDYFRTYPEVSEDIRYELSGFLNQLNIPMRDINGQAIITQACVPPRDESVISILLDIAVSMIVNLPSGDPSLDSKMTNLRMRKNELFEACIKQPARDLIREFSA
jgi:uncharacterized protein (TIGR04255 family)